MTGNLDDAPSHV